MQRVRTSDRALSSASRGQMKQARARRRAGRRPRQPEPKEVDLARSLLGSDKSNQESWELYCQVLLCSNEFIYID